MTYADEHEANLKRWAAEDAKKKVQKVQQLFASLTDEQRAEVTAGYCRHCWRNDPQCQCWNDE